MAKKKSKKVAKVKPRVWRGTGWVYDVFTRYRADAPPTAIRERTPAFNTQVRITMTEILSPPRK